MVSGPETDSEKLEVVKLQLESAKELADKLKKELDFEKLKLESEYERRVFVEKILRKIID